MGLQRESGRSSTLSGLRGRFAECRIRLGSRQGRVGSMHRPVGEAYEPFESDLRLTHSFACDRAVPAGEREPGRTPTTRPPRPLFDKLQGPQHESPRISCRDQANAIVATRSSRKWRRMTMTTRPATDASNNAACARATDRHRARPGRSARTRAPPAATARSLESVPRRSRFHPAAGPLPRNERLPQSPACAACGDRNDPVPRTDPANDPGRVAQRPQENRGGGRKQVVRALTGVQQEFGNHVGGGRGGRRRSCVGVSPPKHLDHRLHAAPALGKSGHDTFGQRRLLPG